MLRHLRDPQQLEGCAVDFATVGNGFAERFARYLLTRRNLVDSAVQKNLFRLKHFLNWALDNGYPVIADPKKFNWRHREPDILTLTCQKVQRLVDLDLSARPALDNARALFLVGAYTGLRFSDVAALRPEHIQAARFRVTTQKTRLTDANTVQLLRFLFVVLVPFAQNSRIRSVRSVTEEMVREARAAATKPPRPAPLPLFSNVATLCSGGFKPAAGLLPGKPPTPNRLQPVEVLRHHVTKRRHSRPKVVG